MSILSFIGGIFKPATDLIDNLHTSDEEKMELRNRLAEIKESALSRMVELEKTAIDAESKIRVAEASSDHWLTSNWRPLTSITLVTLLLLGSFDVVTLNAQVYELAQWFLSGYAGGRSIEKAASVVGKVMGK